MEYEPLVPFLVADIYEIHILFKIYFILFILYYFIL